MARVLHERIIRSAGRRHHDAHVYAPLDRSPERFDRFRLRYEVWVLDPDALAGDANDRMVKNFNGGRGSFGLEECSKHGRIARFLLGWENVVAYEQLSRFARPVLAEC